VSARPKCILRVFRAAAREVSPVVRIVASGMPISSHNKMRNPGAAVSVRANAIFQFRRPNSLCARERVRRDYKKCDSLGLRNSRLPQYIVMSPVGAPLSNTRAREIQRIIKKCAQPVSIRRTASVRRQKTKHARSGLKHSPMSLDVDRSFASACHRAQNSLTHTETFPP